MEIDGRKIAPEQLSAALNAGRRLNNFKEIFEAALLISYLGIHSITCYAAFHELGKLWGSISIPCLVIAEPVALVVSFFRHGFVNLYSGIVVGWFLAGVYGSKLARYLARPGRILNR